MKKLFFPIVFFASISIFAQSPGKDELFKGNERYRAKDYEEAIKWYNITIEKNPKNGSAHLNRGNCKYLLNDKDGGLSRLDKERRTRKHGR